MHFASPAASAVPHAARHAVAPQMYVVQAVVPPEVQEPVPLHELALVWMAPVQDWAAPQLVLAFGYTHAPVPEAQAVAPQAPPVHAAAQQLPEPATSQTPEAQALFLPQTVPGVFF